MRQLPSPELNERRDARVSRSASVGASAAVLGAAALVAKEAGGQQQIQPASALPAPTAGTAPAALEVVLMAPMNGEAAAAPAPVAAVSAPAVPATFQGTAVLPATNLAPVPALPAAELALAPIAQPAIMPSMMPVSAVSLVGNVQEVAQQQTAAPAPTDSGSYWPEGHWESDAGGGLGMFGSMIGLGTAAALGGAGWLAWRLFDTGPEFNDPWVVASFVEKPCLRTAKEGEKRDGEWVDLGDIVYIAEAKHGGNGDTLTYSIVEYETDDSSLFSIDAETGEVRFLSDPGYYAPGDLDRDGTYNFVVQAEDNWGNTDTQRVELSIEQDPMAAFTVNANFIQHGGSVCADEFDIKSASDSPSLFDVSGGLGNDYAFLDAALLPAASPAGSVEYDLGVDLGLGNDTFHIDTGATGQGDILVDLGSGGRDTVVIDEHVLNLVIQNFDENDLIYLDGSYLSISADLEVDYDRKDGAIAMPYPSEAAAIGMLGANEVVGYFNGEDSFLLISAGTAKVAASTIKLQDYILTDYDQIIA